MVDQPDQAQSTHRRKSGGLWLTAAAFSLTLAAIFSVRAGLHDPATEPTTTSLAAESAQQPISLPTPVMIPLRFPDDLRPVTPEPYLPAEPFPAELLGKILFLSHLSGYLEAYAIDPDTRQVWVLTDIWPHQYAEERDAFSANRQYRGFVEDGYRTETFCYWDYDPVYDVEYEECFEFDGIPQYRLRYHDRQFDVSRELTRFGAGDAWDPAWSPVSDSVVFVSNDSGNDEIWVVTKDRWPALQLTRNEWEWDKHPSWSPDGRQIVFMSNRAGQQQLWLMNDDGSNQRPLTDLLYPAYDPVWVKYVGEEESR